MASLFVLWAASMRVRYGQRGGAQLSVGRQTTSTGEIAGRSYRLASHCWGDSIEVCFEFQENQL